MKTGNLLYIGILAGFVLFGFWEFSDFDPIYGGIIGAVIVGILFGKFLDIDSIKSAFIIILTYNLVAWILTFLFTPDGKLMLQSGNLVVLVFIGTVLVLAFINSIIGSFVAFVASKRSRKNRLNNHQFI